MKLIIITYPENITAYRLAGVEVVQPSDNKSVADILEDIVRKGSCGIVAMEEDFFKRIPEWLTKKIYKQAVPVLVAIRSPRRWLKEEESFAYVGSLIRRAIGYQIKLKR